MVHSLVGKAAPTISGPDSNGGTYNFTPGTGAPAVLFFYPKSGSYGCTKEACQLQSLSEMEAFKEANVQIVGVSPDPVEKQKVFVKKHKLTYPVLSDESGDIRKGYGIGSTFFGMSRSTRTTFVIDKTGTVRAVLDAMLDYGAHAKFVHKELDKLAEEKKDDVAAPDATAVPANGQQEPAVTAV